MCLLLRYKTWKFYVFCCLAYFIFLLALTGYTLARFGKVYEGQDTNELDWTGTGRSGDVEVEL